MLSVLNQIFFTFNGLAILAAFIVSLVRRNKRLLPVQIYIFSNLFFYVFLLLTPHTEEGRIIHNISFNISMMIDLSVLYYYYFRIITLRRLSLWLRVLYWTFVSVTLYFWLGPLHTFDKFWVTSYGLENLFITIPCFFYFYQIFRSEEIIDFKTNPDFFVICGLLFFYGTTFPFYISYNAMYNVTPVLYRTLLLVNNILSGILFITIAKAYLCPQPEEKSY